MSNTLYAVYEPSHDAEVINDLIGTTTKVKVASELALKAIKHEAISEVVIREVDYEFSKILYYWNNH